MRKVCHYCEKPFLEGEHKKFIPIERPYMNLILHEECKALIEKNLEEYLSTNLERCYKLWKDGGK